MRGLTCLLLVPGLLLIGGAAQAQQPAAEGARATIQCGGQAYVPITADEEQGIPLRIVEKAACGEQVIVLSDPQGYTVRVRTAAGKVGYVARYQIAIETAPKAASSASGAEASRPGASSGESSVTNSSAEPIGPPKPRVYVSDAASWNASGGFSNPSSVAKGALYGGYNPDMVDVYQDFTSDCSAITVTQEKSKADFVVLFDKGSSKKGWTGLGGLVKVNKVTVLARNGETVLSQSAHSSDAAVRMACEAVSGAGTSKTGSSQPAKTLR